MAVFGTCSPMHQPLRTRSVTRLGACFAALSDHSAQPPLQHMAKLVKACKPCQRCWLACGHIYVCALHHGSNCSNMQMCAALELPAATARINGARQATASGRHAATSASGASSGRGTTRMPIAFAVPMSCLHHACSVICGSSACFTCTNRRTRSTPFSIMRCELGTMVALQRWSSPTLATVAAPSARASMAAQMRPLRMMIESVDLACGRVER